MRGSHNIIVETERMKYEFTIRRNITVVLGDSATGKTTLVDYLGMYSARGKGSGVTVLSDVPCVVFTSIAGMWQAALEEIHGSIVFIDEGQPFIFSQDFADAVQASDNYYVLITRRPLHNLPYSINEIYGIRTTGKYHFPEKIYQEFYPIYEDTKGCSSENETVLLVEDSGSGYDFFRKNLPHILCISAGGNSKIVEKLGSVNSKNHTLVLADGAAFGSYIESVISISNINQNIGLYLPESFEWLILKSGIINNTQISSILEHPEDYIDSSVYFSWERFFTDLLIKETADDNLLRYSKSHLPEYYISERCIQKVLDVMPDNVKQYLKER